MSENNNQKSRVAQLALRSAMLSIGAVEQPEFVEFALGAGAVSENHAWVVVLEQCERSLGPVLLWAQKYGATSLDVFVVADAGLVSRRAQFFDRDIRVWLMVDKNITRAESDVVLAMSHVIESHEQFAALIAQSGAVVVREHGVLSGEVMGLEVCRVVVDDYDDTPHLEIGVGAHDRETFQMLHGKVATLESLVKVVNIVREHRQSGSEHHPLNRLAAERLLRHRVIVEPQLVGASSLQISEPPVQRLNVKDAAPCCAVGMAEDGQEIVVVCTASVDVDVVSFAADARARIAPNAQLVIATHTNNVTPSLAKLAKSLRIPARFVEVAPVVR
jgi:hypothetical protein